MLTFVTRAQTRLGNSYNLSTTLTIWRCLELEWSNSCIHTLACPESVLDCPLKTFRLFSLYLNIYSKCSPWICFTCAFNSSTFLPSKLNISIVHEYICFVQYICFSHLPNLPNFINIKTVLLLWGELTNIYKIAADWKEEELLCKTWQTQTVNVKSQYKVSF